MRVLCVFAEAVELEVAGGAAMEWNDDGLLRVRPFKNLGQ
jgi:hypothetical protein